MKNLKTIALILSLVLNVALVIFASYQNTRAELKSREADVAHELAMKQQQIAEEMQAKAMRSAEAARQAAQKAQIRLQEAEAKLKKNKK